MLGNLGRMMRLAAAVKGRLPELGVSLEKKRYSAQAGDEAVIATVNGKGRLVDIEFDEEFLDDERPDADTLEDLVIEAVTAAQDKAARAAAGVIRELTGGLSVPGLDGLL